MYNTNYRGVIMSISNNSRPDIKSVEAFAAVVSCGSMTAAAQVLSISQPAVTRMVRDLEKRVGFSLFERNGPRISPTPKGMKFFEESQRVLANFTQLTKRARAIRDEKIAAIDIVATPTMTSGLVAPVLARISGLLPDYINIETTTAERVVHGLRQRTADIGFSAFPIEHDRLKCLARFESKLVAVVQEGSRYDTTEPLPLSVFKEERLATIDNNYRIGRDIRKAFEKMGISPPSEIATNSSLSAAMAARVGMAIAICDPITAVGAPIKGVKLRPLSVPIKYEWGLFANEELVLKEHLSKIIEACTIESERIIQRVNELGVKP